MSGGEFELIHNIAPGSQADTLVLQGCQGLCDWRLGISSGFPEDPKNGTVFFVDKDDAIAYQKSQDAIPGNPLSFLIAIGYQSKFFTTLPGDPKRIDPTSIGKAAALAHKSASNYATAFQNPGYGIEYWEWMSSGGVRDTSNWVVKHMQDLPEGDYPVSIFGVYTPPKPGKQPLKVPGAGRQALPNYKLN
jgi:hypothetical protein